MQIQRSRGIINSAHDATPVVALKAVPPIAVMLQFTFP